MNKLFKICYALFFVGVGIYALTNESNVIWIFAVPALLLFLYTVVIYVKDIAEQVAIIIGEL